MRPDRIAGFVSLACFIVYALTAPRTIGFGDSPELIAAANSLGVAHPPGYPLYTLLGWLALRIPLGEPAFVMNLLSAVFASLAAGGVTWLVLRLTSSRAAAVTAGLVLAFSSTFWYVAIIAEVYSLHLFLLVALFCAAEAVGSASTFPGRRAALFAGASALGLGLAHHPTIVLALPAATALTLAGRSAAPRNNPERSDVQPLHIVIAGLIVVVLPMLLYGSLIWRARMDPATNWGNVINIDALTAHISALTYRHLDLGWGNLLRGIPWKHLAGLVLAEFSWLVPPLALAGLIPFSPASRTGSGLRLRLGLLLLIVPSLLFGLRYDVEDVEVYYLPAFLGMALAAGVGVSWLTDSGVPRRRWVGLSIAVVLVGWTFLGNLPSRSLARMTAARDYAEDVMNTVPYQGILFVRSLESFGLLYLTQVQGWRPDVTIYHRNGNLFIDPLSRYGVERTPGESLREYRIRVEQALIDTELRRRSGRAIMFQGWPGYPAPERYRIEPVGLLHRVRPATDLHEVTEMLWNEYRGERVASQARKLGDPLALALAATYPIARGELAYYQSIPWDAQAQFEIAAEVSNHDAGVLSYIGTVYGRYDDLAHALEVLESAVQRRPSSYKAWNNLAIARELADDAEGAREALRKSLEIAPGQGTAAASLQRLELALPESAP